MVAACAISMSERTLTPPGLDSRLQRRLDGGAWCLMVNVYTW
jgi:hypothetical protein